MDSRARANGIRQFRVKRGRDVHAELLHQRRDVLFVLAHDRVFSEFRQPEITEQTLQLLVLALGALHVLAVAVSSAFKS